MLPSFINMLSWWQWLLVGWIPPAIVALYFLKLRREPLEVPSTYLWQKSIEDLHVNSLWQRLRQNLLLLLQLLLLILVMLAMIRPSWKSTALSGDRFIFLVDHSASMSATDIEPSRFEEARQEVRELIDQMDSGDKAMIISFADNAQVVQEFTDNRRLLRQRLETMEPTHRPTSLHSALNLAAGLANPGRSASDPTDIAAAEALPADMYIFSDGKFADVQEFQLGNLKPIYVPLGKKDEPNVAIASFSTRRHESRPTEVQAFGMVELHTEDDEATQTVIVDLYVDGSYRESQEIELAAGSPTGISFDLGQMESGALRLELNSQDALPVDDVAYAAVNVPRRGRVLLVTAGNEALEWSLTTERSQELAEVRTAPPSVLDTEDYRQESLSGAYDLIIYDQCRPAEPPQAHTLFIGALPPALVAEEVERPYSPWVDAAGEAEVPRVAAPQVIDINHAHPLMQLVELGDVFIAGAIPLDPPPGSTTLIDSTKGTIAAIAPRGGFEDAVLGFGIISREGEQRFFNTDWWRRLSFPTFVFNSLYYLGGHRQAVGGSTIRPGEIYRISTESQAEKLTVHTPRGEVQTVRRGSRNEFVFSATDRVGIYEVRDENKLLQRFSVNLFDSSESDIAPRGYEENAIAIGYNEIEAQTAFEPARREIWKWLLLAGLGILLLEWYIYNRRVYI